MKGTAHHTLNTHITRLNPSATLAINEQCQSMIDQGQRVFRLGFGQSPFPVPQIVVDELKHHAHQKAYLPVKGFQPLRQAVSDFFQRTEQLCYTPEQIMIGPGTKELMFILQSVLESELLLPAPSWVSYAPQAEILGREITWLPGDLVSNPDLVAEALDQVCAHQPNKPRLLVLNYPINPTGGTYSEPQLKSIAERARHYGLIILSDEIYSGLHFQGGHQSIARYYPEGTIISNGLSKWCGAGGWRLGAFAFPEELEDLRLAMTVMATETYSAVASPVQYAAIKAFEHSAEMDDYLQTARMILIALMNHCYQQLLAAGAELSLPEGGFYLFPRVNHLAEVRGINDSASLCSAILADTGVAVLPGSAFGRPANELSMRVACVDFNGAQAMAAASGLSELPEGFIQQYCADTIEAVDRLAVWFTR